MTLLVFMLVSYDLMHFQHTENWLPRFCIVNLTLENWTFNFLYNFRMLTVGHIHVK